MRLTGTSFNPETKLNKNRTLYSYEPSKSYYINYNMNDLNNYDIDSIKEELMKTKNDYNQLKKLYHDLKISYSKLENENKENVKLIENLFNEGNTNRIANNVDSEENNDENETEEMIKNIKENISKNSKMIAKEKYINQNMKIELLNLREKIKEKDIIINNLKVNSKASKMQDLDDKYAKTYQELLSVSEKYSKAQIIENDYFELKNQTYELNQQLEYYKKQSKQQKETIEKMNNTISNYKKEKEMSFINGNLSDRRKKNNLQSISELYKKQLDDRENIIKQLEKEIDFMNKKKERKNNENKEIKEKKLEEKIKDNNEKIKKLNKENEKQKNKIKELEESNLGAYIEIDKLRNKKPQMRNLSIIEKECKEIKWENKALKEEIAKIKQLIKKKEDDEKKAKEKQNVDKEIDDNFF